MIESTTNGNKWGTTADNPIKDIKRAIAELNIRRVPIAYLMSEKSYYLLKIVNEGEDFDTYNNLPIIINNNVPTGTVCKEYDE